MPVILLGAEARQSREAELQTHLANAIQARKRRRINRLVREALEEAGVKPSHGKCLPDSDRIAESLRDDYPGATSMMESSSSRHHGGGCLRDSDRIAASLMECGSSSTRAKLDGDAIAAALRC